MAYSCMALDSDAQCSIPNLEQDSLSNILIIYPSYEEFWIFKAMTS